MVAKLKPYSAYRDSGVPWLGEVPAHWETNRAKGLFRKMERPVKDSDEVITCFRDGIVTLRKNRRVRGFTESLKEIGYQGVLRGDLVIHAMDAFAGAAGVSDSDGKGTSVYSVCTPLIESVDPYYYAFCVREMARSEWILALAKGIRERSTDFRFAVFASQIVPFPPLPEQTAIVRFLDHADRRIQRYIHAKQKLMALLEEQKQAIVHQAVTGQIDVRTGQPYPAYKPSGVEWLGDVPAHWEVRRLKSLVKRIDQGVSPQADNYLADGTAWGVLKAGCVNRGVFREGEHKRLPPDFVFDSALAVTTGDVLVSRASGSAHLVGSVGRVSSLKYKLILSDKTFRPIFKQQIDPDFMVLAMNSRYYRQQVELAISGAEGLANNLPLSSLRAFHFAVPAFDEQHNIVEHLQTSTNKLSTAATQAEREMALLHEYRTRLIADVVTGKLDVREAAARLPDGEAKPKQSDKAQDLIDAAYAER
ncbi:MAG: restriction endonuclease subunit S [Desulfurellaceae bacterium]|nr:restriction endonuclease subunit S [Desulfurellaceae bacterium]